MRRVQIVLRGISAFLLTLPLLAGFSLTGQAESLKAALVLPGVITDKSANQSSYEGLMRAKETLGIEVAYSEKIAQPDQAEALADYARRGYDVVVGMGGEFQDSAERVAQKFPNTMFVIINGSNSSSNIACLRFKETDVGYALGYLGGKMSETGIGAYIGAQQITSMLNLQKGYEKGFMAARPDGRVLTAWTADWDDIAKGKEATLTCISQGADVIWSTMDNAIIGCYQAAREKEKWAMGIYYDYYKDWPDIMLQSIVMQWSQALFRVLTIATEGNLTGMDYLIGFEEPLAVSLGTFNPAIPEDLKQEILQLIEDMIAGKIDTSA